MFIVRRQGSLRIYQNKKNLVKQLRQDIKREEAPWFNQPPGDMTLDTEVIEVKDVNKITVRELLGQ